jgi:hypothetical protein
VGLLLLLLLELLLVLEGGLGGWSWRVVLEGGLGGRSLHCASASASVTIDLAMCRNQEGV